MCGIAGVLYADRARPVDLGVLKAMGNAIAHRGPDGEGFWSDPGLGMVHRRLSIIDLSGGGQPIGNEDGSVQVVFNGEIYNYIELRADLEKRGHRFRTSSDTEVLVHLYEDHGSKLVERLRGMFAFAIWDRKQRRLVLARDRVGIKPLFLYRDHEKFLFASELKAILAHPAVDRAIDLSAVDDFLALGMVPGGRAIFRKAAKLPAAHIVTIQSEDLHAAPKRYWQLNFEPDEQRSFDDWQEAIRAKLRETVRIHMLADVPVGAFLSGGVDSSIVVSEACGQANGPLRTFSIGFQEEEFSELTFAREIAQRYGTQHEEAIVTADAVSLIDQLTHFYDEPFGDSSAIPTFLLSGLAAQHVKVVLSGDGGDEAFGGYNHYAHDLREASIRQLQPRWFRRLVLGSAARVWPKADWLPRPLRLKTFLTNLSLDPGDAYANTLSLCPRSLRRRLLSPDLLSSLKNSPPENLIRVAYDRVSAKDPLSGMIATDMETFLPDDYLVKVDRASMAHGLEVRPPMLDHELLELAARIPSRWKIKGKVTKWILKKAYEQELPSDVLWRRKQGFEIPIDQWLRGTLRPYFEEGVLKRGSVLAGLIDQSVARQLFRSHLTGRGRHGATLWCLLVLSRWTERYLSNEPLTTANSLPPPG